MILVDSFGSITPLKLPRLNLNVQIVHKYSYKFSGPYIIIDPHNNSSMWVMELTHMVE